MLANLLPTRTQSEALLDSLKAQRMTKYPIDIKFIHCALKPAVLPATIAARIIGIPSHKFFSLDSRRLSLAMRFGLYLPDFSS